MDADLTFVDCSGKTMSDPDSCILLRTSMACRKSKSRSVSEIPIAPYRCPAKSVGTPLNAPLTSVLTK
jgi:hypothetical protein